MKKLIYLLCLLVLCAELSAQEISVDKKSGIITKDGTQIGQIKKSKGLLKSYTLYDQDGEEVATFEPQSENDDVYYVIFFGPTGNKGTCNSTISLYKDIAKAYGKSGIILDGEYQESKEARMLSALDGGRYFGDDVKDEKRADASPPISSSKEELLERDRDEPVELFGNDILQDDETIGEYELDQEAINGGIRTRIKIYNHSGKLIAEAVATGTAPTSFDVVTMKDNEKSHIQSKYHHTAVQEIVEALVSRYYL